MNTRLLVLASIVGTLIASLLPNAVRPSVARTPTEDVAPLIAAERQMGTTADTIPPSAVVTLTATTGNSPGTVNLTWIAPGDDATTGTAAVYIVRYNTTTITESNWNMSIDVTGEPTPSPAGRVESMTVSGLMPGKMYHFAIKTRDEASNTSGVSNSPEAVTKSGPFSIYLPLVASSVSVLPVIPVTTNVLTHTTTQYLSSISGDGAVFTFTQSTSALNAVAPGEVIVGDVTANAPYGFLRKVTSISPVGGQVVVATTQATLEDAIQMGSVHISQVLTPDQIQRGMQAKGVTLVEAPESLGEFFFTLEDVVLYDDDGNLSTTNDQIRADGSIQLEPGFDFNLVVEYRELKELAFTTSAQETAEIKLKAEVELASIKKEKEIGRYTFSPVTVMVGPMPVVIVPVLTVNVGVDGSVHVGVTAGVEQRATLLAGLRYAGGVWQPVSDFSNQFTWNPPTLSAGLDLKGYAGVRLSLLLYGVVGPYADINAFLKLEANIADNPWWTLSGGLEVPAGVKVEVLGHSLVDYEGPTIAFGLILAQAQSNNPPNLPFAPYPANGAFVQNLNTDLSWSGGDLDGDAVTYDVYFEAGDNTPDVLVAHDQTGIAFDPGTLSPNTTYYWRIVAKDEHGTTNVGPVWDFTTATGATCPITLTLQSPQIDNLSVVINGTATSACSTIIRINWQWGDGVGSNQRFPAGHTYAVSGTYPITVTAYNSLGQIQVQTTAVTVSLDITIDRTYTIGYWGNLKSTFRPGEAIYLVYVATNHLAQTVPVTYTWATYDPNGVKIPVLSYDVWPRTISPGEDSARLLRGIPVNASLGLYAYTQTVTYASGSSAGSTYFLVQGTPIALHLLEAATSKNVQNNRPVDRTSSFTTNDSRVYAWSAWEGISGNHTLRWEWYRPDGTLHYTYPYDFNASESFWQVWSWISVPSLGNYFGQWSIKIYMDGSYQYTLYFTLASATQLGAINERQAVESGAGDASPQMILPDPYPLQGSH
jgi:hypothetical protein